MGLGRQKPDAAEGALEQLVGVKETNAKKVADEIQDTYRSSRMFMLVMVAGGVLIGLGLGIFIARSISHRWASWRRWRSRFRWAT